MVGGGHRLLGGPLGRDGQVLVAVVGLMVMMVVMVVSGHVTGRGSVVQLRVKLQRRRNHGRVTATAADTAAMVNAARLVVDAVVLAADGHHVVRGATGSGRRVRCRRVGGPGPGRRRRMMVRRRRHRRLFGADGLLLLITPDRRKHVAAVLLLLVTVCRRQQLLLQATAVGNRVRKRRHNYNKKQN